MNLLIVSTLATVLAVALGAFVLLVKRRRVSATHGPAAVVAENKLAGTKKEKLSKKDKKKQKEREKKEKSAADWRINHEDIKLPKVYFGDFGTAVHKRPQHAQSAQDAPMCPFAEIFAKKNQQMAAQTALSDAVKTAQVPDEITQPVVVKIPDPQPAGKANQSESESEQDELNESQSWTIENGQVRKRSPMDLFLKNTEQISDRERYAEEMRQEAEVRKQQLEAIFKLLQEQEQKARGESCSMDELADQMKLYI